MRLDENREVKVIDIETRYIDPETGRLLSSREFILKLAGNLPLFYRDESQLRQIWSNPDTREELLQHLADIGIGSEQLADLSRMFEAEDSDIFDILAHLSFNSDILYRRERRQMAEKMVETYETLGAREFLEFLLVLYVRNGIGDFRRDSLSSKIELYNRGTTAQIARQF